MIKLGGKLAEKAVIVRGEMFTDGALHWIALEKAMNKFGSVNVAEDILFGYWFPEEGHFELIDSAHDTLSNALENS